MDHDLLFLGLKHVQHVETSNAIFNSDEQTGFQLAMRCIYWRPHVFLVCTRLYPCFRKRCVYFVLIFNAKEFLDFQNSVNFMVSRS